MEVAEEFPACLDISVEKVTDLRYGENPHQRAAFYRLPGTSGLPDARILHGKALSFNNLLDLDAAWGMVIDFDAPAVAVIKHNNPCGLAAARELSVAYNTAVACDPLSAYGSVIACNVAVDRATAEAMSELFIEAIIAPLETITRQLWAGLGDFTMILYPFVEGRDGYETAPSDAQWLKFGAALRSLHTALTGVQGTALTGVQGTTLTPLRAFEAQEVQGAAALPADLAGRLPGETFPAEWREQVAGFQAQVEENSYPDPIAARVADLMRARREEIHRLVARTETLARALRERPPAPGWEPVLCHTDIHPGNLLLGANDALYIVDWDNPVLAPRERDLMLIGGCAAWNDPRAVALFYQG